MKNINVTMALFLGILVMLFFLLRSCDNDEIDALESKISLLQGSNDSLYTLTNKLGQTVTSQEAQIVQSKEELSKYADSIFKLKNKHQKQIAATIAYWKSRVEVEVHDVPVPYLDTPGIGFFKRREIGSKKIQFYKKKSYEVQTMHSSPLFNTTWQKSYIYVPPKKYMLPKILIAVGAGILISKILL